MIAAVFPDENSSGMPRMAGKKNVFLSLSSTPRHWIPMGSNDSINSPAIFLLSFYEPPFPSKRPGSRGEGTRKQGGRNSLALGSRL